MATLPVLPTSSPPPYFSDLSPAPLSSPVVGTISANDLQGAKVSALSRNLSLDSPQVSQALAQAAAALAAIASALQGKIGAAPGSLSPDPVSVTAAVNEFLRAKARAGRSDRYLRALRVSLGAFANGRRLHPLASVTVADIESWLDAADWAQRTKRGYLADVRTLFNFAVRRGMVANNPAAAVELPALESRPPAIHSPSQVRAVLRFALEYDRNLCRALAVRYFAGLRSAELERIEEMDIGREFVEVPAHKAKTRRRRLVTIQPALAAWLELGGALPIRDVSNRWRMFTAKLLAATGVPWPANVTRHSFCSYHLAEFQNAGKTALESGHSEAMLFAHYRALVTPAAAAEFWSIRPT